MRRNSFLTPETAKQRIAAQLPQSLKEKEADFVIDNSFGLEETEKQVVKIIEFLKNKISLK